MGVALKKIYFLTSMEFGLFTSLCFAIILAIFPEEKKKKMVEQGEGCLKLGNHPWYLNQGKALKALVLGNILLY